MRFSIHSLFCAAAVLVGAVSPSLALTSPPPCTFADGESYDTGHYPHFVAIGDLDGDLDLDLVIANGTHGGHLSIVLNNGDGTFANLDGDLDLDLAVANLETGLQRRLGPPEQRRTGLSRAARHIYGGGRRGPYSVAIGDLDGDLDLDLAVANHKQRRRLDPPQRRRRDLRGRRHLRRGQLGRFSVARSATWTATSTSTSPWRISGAR